MIYTITTITEEPESIVCKLDILAALTTNLEDILYGECADMEFWGSNRSIQGSRNICNNFNRK